ncbi:MAG: metal ABC transporter substrate-binding protein [Verrucomicrobiota bacterium]
MKLPIPVLVVSLAFLASCDKAFESASVEGPSVAAVNYPLAYFAERLTGDFATIIFDCPEDEDPAFWKPTDADIARMQSADVILLNGATYAKWAATASLPKSKTVDTSIAFKDQWIFVEEAITHSHGDDEEEHSHGGTAFTTWIDFEQAILQATAVKGALTRAFPDQKDTIETNFAALQTDLEDVDNLMADAAKGLQDAPVIASHPIYQYFARAYEVEVIELVWEPEMDVDEKAIADLKAAMEAHPGAKYFMWEGEPLAESVEALEGLGLTSFVFTQCPNRPESGDFLSVMKENIEAMKSLP